MQANDGCVWISIGDDGVGGADPGRGSGLVGLRDRIASDGIVRAVSHGVLTKASLQAQLERILPAGSAPSPTAGPP